MQSVLYFPDQFCVIFFQNIIEQVFLTNQKLKIFKTKYMVNFKKYAEVEKNLPQSKKTSKTSELVERYQKVECGICCVPHTKTEAYVWQSAFCFTFRTSCVNSNHVF